MEPKILDGQLVANQLEYNLKKHVKEYKERTCGRVPHLAVCMVGNNYASRKYTRMKVRMAERVGMEATNIYFSEEHPPEVIISRIVELNYQPHINGIMLQHPVAEIMLHLERTFFDAISPEKDVDGLTSTNFSKLSLGSNTSSFRPATAAGIMVLLSHYLINIRGMSVTIIGSSPILGLPLSMLMHRAGATVSLCNINTKASDLVRLCQSADMIVGACGRPGMITDKLVKEGAILIDAGCNPGNVGDIDPRAYKKSSYYTPMPGSVGPLTTITLLLQTMQAAEEQENEGNKG